LVHTHTHTHTHTHKLIVNVILSASKISNQIKKRKYVDNVLVSFELIIHCDVIDVIIVYC